jgi:hypothetical protein
MRERGILFSAEMVKTLLAGRKTQTRRTVSRVFAGRFFGDVVADAILDVDGMPSRLDIAPENWECCPYGVPGDRLWVRETFAFDVSLDDVSPSTVLARSGVQYKAGNVARDQRASFERGRWRPGIHMPRWASRILLEITNVRVQRVQDISEEDARAEGIDRIVAKVPLHRDAYRLVWGEINGADGFSAKSWAANPWVWCLTFRRVTAAAS